MSRLGLPQEPVRQIR
uniref:Nudix hydrolase 7 n=1 Tax=Gorilla gorilla gorilla TaxID=9595 RepID=A0A2I2ZLY3_GORGO